MTNLTHFGKTVGKTVLAPLPVLLCAVYELNCQTVGKLNSCELFRLKYRLLLALFQVDKPTKSF